MGTSDFYNQPAYAFNREWVDNHYDGSEMTQEEQAAFRIEMDAVNAEAAEYRKQEREEMVSSRSSEGNTFDMDAPF